ncbi:gluconokinase [Aureimonas leprariae]|uniref:Gluconokinase n=2 Tax=Plantimonas leprariae TaxID=2615207 RepID=A0A7V7PNN2_9HYPH|nr:gluconokinase [Aureimonas leprariae]
MGPSGVGKTTVAEGIAAALGRRFAEADEFHSAEAVAKMRGGTPLTDADRWPWLARIRDWITAEAEAGRSTVLTCSALKRAYRDILREAKADVRFVFLTGDPALIAQRIGAREGHYMPPSLLASQLADLEALGEDEPGVRVDVAGTPDEIVRDALGKLGLSPATAREA